MTTTRQEGEIRFPDHISLISTTDPTSHITYANQHFCDVTGYSAAEMEGVPHNLVRHPDMPRAAFADMWQRLQQGEAQITTMRANYLGGNYGYGHAKQALFELIVGKFKTERERYNYYINNLTEVDSLLKQGAEKAAGIANGVLDRVRLKLGFESLQ